MALTVEMVGAIPLIGPPGSNIEGLNCIVKRGFDIAVATLMTLAGLAVFLAGLVILTRRILDRRRLAGWENAWLSVGPTWSRHG